MLKLVYCGWIAALVRESLIERSNTSSRPVQLTDVSGPQFDLRADLSGANLCITILQFCPTWYINSLLENIMRWLLRQNFASGVRSNPWDVWLDEKKRQEIADLAKFTEEEYRTHSILIITFHELLCGKK